MAKTAHGIADEAQTLIERADEVRGKFLRANGWQYTSSTPNCYWMWLKEWHGKQWSYHNAADALRAESWMADFPDAPAAGVGESLQAKALNDPPEVIAAEFDRMVDRAARNAGVALPQTPKEN